MANTDTADRVQIAGALGFEQHPAARHADDGDWLLAHCDAAIYAEAMADLPAGGWTTQGLCEVVLDGLTAPRGSAAHLSAVTNSRLAHGWAA